MTATLRIPLPGDIFDEIDDAFVSEDETANDFVWKSIRQLCKDAKVGKLNKVCTVNIVKDGKAAQDPVKLKGLTLDEALVNPEWLPPNLDKEDAKYFEHKVTDKTMEYLKLYCSFAILRHTKYSDSVAKENETLEEKMKKDNKDPETIKKTLESSAEALETFREQTPKYLEQIIFNAIYPALHNKVIENIDKEFDKENEELYPKVDAKAA